MRLIIFLIAALVMSGCVTQKRCLSKFPPQTVTERSDSIVIRDSIVYRDRIIRDTIPADTVFTETKLPADIPADIKISPITLENRYARAHAWVENRLLKLRLELKEQVIETILKDAEKETTHWKEMYYSEYTNNTQVVYRAKPIHKASLVFSGAVILLFLLWLYFKIKK